jgi:hypothetical protein
MALVVSNFRFPRTEYSVEILCSKTGRLLLYICLYTVSPNACFGVVAVGGSCVLESDNCNNIWKVLADSVHERRSDRRLEL